MKRILVGHVDLDGCGIIVLGELFNKQLQFDDIIMKDYDFEKDPEVWSYINSYDEIVIADLTFDREYVDKNKNMLIFDHHAKTSWVSEDFPKSVWDETRCGTKIFWEEYVKPKIKRYNPIIDYFVELVDTYDTWKENSELWESAKNLNNVLYGIKDYKKSTDYERLYPFISLMEKKFQKLETWRWTRIEKELIQKANKREEDMYNTAMGHLSIRKDSEGKIFGVCMLPSKISITASRILTEESNLDYLAIINSYGGVNGKISFRSRNGFNCNDIGIANGHDPAAAGAIEIKKVIEFWENENLSFKYNTEYEKDPESPFHEES